MRIESIALGVLGVSLERESGASKAAIFTTLLLIAPLEEALKLLPVWFRYARHRIDNLSSGVLSALASAAGFAAVETAFIVYADSSTLNVARALLGIPAHLFFAAAWGYALGGRSAARGQWFTVAWLLSTLLHGLYDHIVFGRGAALLVVVLPLLIAMAVTTWSALGEIMQRSPPSSRRHALLGNIPEPPSLKDVRKALKRPDRPLLLHWIGIGGLATLGMMLALFAAAVYAGHRLGFDFAITDEGDVRSGVPIIVLGSAVLAAFPMATFLIARSSSATNVLEPVLGAVFAIALLLLVLAMTAPVALVSALTLAPAAFVLACAGAWLGLSRN
jgi:RsiW-degrading membrane proteinase PrsW (M82 family)